MARQHDLPPSLAPIGAGRETAAAYLSLSAGKFQDLVNRGLMPKPKRIDGRLIWDLEEVRLAFKSLPLEDETIEPNPWDDVP
ncbi:hypothetical protein [Methylobacterium sp. WSM2598]|uniref:hypothetical protein n=1 Tax=Methylobacterium sp. WSM2598 TaxID=398261 RepID=UPI0003789A64|nr:hypothetical protein [Methylobacterium sp. WSM2598]